MIASTTTERCTRHPSRDTSWPGAIGCDACCDAALARATENGAGPNEGCAA